MDNDQATQREAMTLTTKERWRYARQMATRRHIETIKRREEWLPVVKEFLPGTELDYLELGCAPGQYTAALAEGTPWAISGIDYSDDAAVFLETLATVGKEAKLYRLDMFQERVPAQFDVVISIGLVEHFRGSLLDEVFALHDSYLRPGGVLVLMVPNFTGFNYFWHYLFDRPDLDRHNVDVMQPAVFEWYAERGYESLFNDYVGVMRLWGNSGWMRYRLLGKAVAGLAVGLSKLARGLGRIGIRLSGRTWSPTLLYIARKKNAPEA